MRMNLRVIHERGKVKIVEEKPRECGGLGSVYAAWKRRGRGFVWDHYADHTCSANRFNDPISRDRIPSVVLKILEADTIKAVLQLKRKGGLEPHAVEFQQQISRKGR